MRSTCPSFDDLVRWLDGDLPEPAREEVAHHATVCDRCAEALERAAAVDVLLVEELAGRPAARSRAWLPLAAAAALLVGLSMFLLRPVPTLSSEEVAAQILPLLPIGAARVAALSGGAELHTAAEAPHTAVANELLRQGDRVSTRAGQRAKLSLAHDADLVLNENSTLRIGSLREGVIEVDLEHGELLASTGRTLEISTPAGLAAVDAGEISVRAGADQTVVSVLRGRGRMKGTALERGEEASLRAKSPLKVRRLEKRTDIRWAADVRRVFFEDDLAAAGASAHWKLSEGATGAVAAGRPALVLVAEPTDRRSFSYARFGRELSVDGPVVFEAEVCLPRDARGGRAQVILPLAGADGPASLRWSFSHDEDVLEAHRDLSGRKHAVLWKGRSGVADGDWHRLRLVLSKTDVVLERDGVRLAQAVHGLPEPQRASLVLGCLVKPKAVEPFECRFAGVRILHPPVE